MVREPCRQIGVVPLEGTGGADAAPLIHCPSAAFPPSSVPPSSSPPGIHLSPPGSESLNDLKGGKEGVQKRKGSFLYDCLLLVSCILEFPASRPLSLTPFWSREGTLIS